MNKTFEETNNKLIGFWTIDAYEGDIVYKNDKLVRLLGTKLYTRLFGEPVILNKKVDSISGYNLITNNGKGLVLDRLFGLSGAVALTGMAIGTSNTAAAVGDTAITGAQFKAFDATPTRASLTVTARSTYGTAEGNINIQEIGLLTAAGGVLFNRIAPVGPFNKTSAVSIQITVTITQA